MATITKELCIDVAKVNRFSAIVAKQNDSNSRFLKVTLTNNGEPMTIESGSVVTINARREDEQSQSFAGTVNDDGTVTVPLTSWMLAYDGTVLCDISIYASGSDEDEETEIILSTMSFEVTVQESALDEDAIADTEDYGVLVTLIAQVQAIQTDEDARVEAEAARVTAENARVSAETARAEAEDARVAAETARSEAEAARVTAETVRADAESARAAAEEERAAEYEARMDAEDAREEAEAARVAAEEARVKAEAARVTAESNRVSAETARADAEAARVTAEAARVTAEKSRASAEADRVAAELARASAETVRANAEASRVSAETARVTAESARVDAENARVDAEAAREAAEIARQETIAGCDEALANAKLATGPFYIVNNDEAETYVCNLQITDGELVFLCDVVDAVLEDSSSSSESE